MAYGEQRAWIRTVYVLDSAEVGELGMFSRVESESPGPYLVDFGDLVIDDAMVVGKAAGGKPGPFR